MKLISMTDFVLDKSKNAPIEDYHKVNGRFVNSVINYANFLKQPLGLGMFVPVDDDGNVLEESTFDSCNRNSNEYFIATQEFQNAKEKVLFEGFEMMENEKGIINKKTFVSLFIPILNHDAIENSIKYDLTLTPNAIKQLGL